MKLDAKSGLHPIASKSASHFVLNLPSRPTIFCYSGIEYMYTVASLAFGDQKQAVNSSSHVHASFIVEDWQIEIGAFYSQNLHRATNLVKIPDLSPLDFFTYLALCSNTLGDFCIRNEPTKDIWNAYDITFAVNPQKREREYKKILVEARKLRREVGWDGKHHYSFNLWSDVEEDEL
eukprot:Phypoly_transcript_22681.p1 GENE.Phypoly_transcript_22681~~Phypoly_transcript_22681.p1  ORF type:complete len:193 (+),score=14.12 Phypoly_transcript_22681:50-580(+)